MCPAAANIFQDELFETSEIILFALESQIFKTIVIFVNFFIELP
jgi:hypothetical protein